jgi:hypothetical protein
MGVDLVAGCLFPRNRISWIYLGDLARRLTSLLTSYPQNLADLTPRQTASCRTHIPSNTMGSGCLTLTSSARTALGPSLA